MLFPHQSPDFSVVVTRDTKRNPCHRMRLSYVGHEPTEVKFKMSWRRAKAKMQLAAALVRSVFSALNLGTRAIVNTDLSDMTVSKCLQLAELSRQQRPQCFGEENRPSAGLNRNESYATRS